MEFRDYVTVLTRSWPLIIVLALVGALGGLGFAELRPATYESTARAIVSTPPAENVGDLGGALTFGQQAVSGYADLATTALVLQPVIDRLNLDTTVAQLALDVDVVPVTDQAALSVTARAPTPAGSARVANAIVAQLASAVSDLTGADADATGVELLTVDPAVAPAGPAGLPAWLLAIIGLLIGLVIALAVGLARELFDTRVRTPQDLARVTDTPVLGTTIRDVAARRRPLVVRDAAGSRRAEDYRTVRSNLGFAGLDDSKPSIVVTSALAGEGKSTAAANLALTVADLGRRVLLVDGDLRRPGLANLLGIDGTIGLADVLAGGATLEQAVQRSVADAIDVLPAGTLPSNPNELAQSAAMDEFLDLVAADYDLVIIDTPPLLAVSDAAVLSQRVGGTVVVAAANRVKRAQLDSAFAVLDRADARVLGTVLTMVSTRDAEQSAGRYAQGPQGPGTDSLDGASTAPIRLSRPADKQRSAW